MLDLPGASAVLDLTCASAVLDLFRGTLPRSLPEYQRSGSATNVKTLVFPYLKYGPKLQGKLVQKEVVFTALTPVQRQDTASLFR